MYTVLYLALLNIFTYFFKFKSCHDAPHWGLVPFIPLHSWNINFFPKVYGRNKWEIYFQNLAAEKLGIGWMDEYLKHVIVIEQAFQWACMTSIMSHLNVHSVYVWCESALHWSHLGPLCSSRWTRQAELTGSGRIRTVTTSKGTSAWYSLTQGLKVGVRVSGGSVYICLRWGSTQRSGYRQTHINSQDGICQPQAKSKSISVTTT